MMNGARRAHTRYWGSKAARAIPFPGADPTFSSRCGTISRRARLPVRPSSVAAPATEAPRLERPTIGCSGGRPSRAPVGRRDARPSTRLRQTRRAPRPDRSDARGGRRNGFDGTGHSAFSLRAAAQEHIKNEGNLVKKLFLQSRDATPSIGAGGRRRRESSLRETVRLATRQSRVGPFVVKRHSPSKDGRLSTPYARAPPPRPHGSSPWAAAGPPGDDAVPTRHFLAMDFDAAILRHRAFFKNARLSTGYGAGPAHRSPWLTDGLSRAEGPRLAEGDPQSGLGLDAGHGSGRADDSHFASGKKG